MVCRFVLDMEYNSSYTQNMKTAISIPDDIFQAAEELSKRLGLSRSALYTKAVAAFLQSQRHTRVQETLDAIYAAEDSHLDPVLAKLQALSLPHEDW